MTKVTFALISRLKFVRESFDIHQLLADMKFTGSAAATEHVVQKLKLNPKLHWEVRYHIVGCVPIDVDEQ